MDDDRDTFPPEHAEPAWARALRVALWSAAALLFVAVILVTTGGWRHASMMPLWTPAALQTFAWVFPDVLTHGGTGATTALFVLVPGLGGLLAAVAAATNAAARRRDAAALLAHLAAAFGLNLPLAAYLRRAAAAEPGRARKRITRMAAALEAGGSVGRALYAVAPELPPRVLDRVAAADRSAALAPAIDHVLRHDLSAGRHTPDRPSATYLLLVGGLVLLVLLLIDVFVAPKFAQIFADFRTPLPPLFAFVFGRLPTPLALALLVGVVLLLLRRLAANVFVARFGRPVLAGGAGPLAWYAPGIGRATRTREYAAACDVLAEALTAGRPLPDAIGTATLPSLNVVLRRKLRRWREAVLVGDAPAPAARAAGLPGVLCDLLAAGRGDPADAVAFAGRAYAAAAERWAVALAAVLPVVATLAVASVVCAVALSLFLPLVRLGEATAMKVYP